MTEILEIWQAIEGMKNDLVTKAKKLCEKFQNNLPDRAQFHNLRTVACSTFSVEEIKGFIRYQIGRCKEGESWRSGFGEEVIEIIDSILAQLSHHPQKAIRAIRLFTGYLIREERYLKG